MTPVEKPRRIPWTTHLKNRVEAFKTGSGPYTPKRIDNKRGVHLVETARKHAVTLHTVKASREKWRKRAETVELSRDKWRARAKAAEAQLAAQTMALRMVTEALRRLAWVRFDAGLLFAARKLARELYGYSKMRRLKPEAAPRAGIRSEADTPDRPRRKRPARHTGGVAEQKTAGVK